jgi:hypothetical protein
MATTSVVQKHGSFLRQGKMTENRTFDYVYGINHSIKLSKIKFKN